MSWDFSILNTIIILSVNHIFIFENSCLYFLHVFLYFLSPFFKMSSIPFEYEQKILWAICPTFIILPCYTAPRMVLITRSQTKWGDKRERADWRKGCTRFSCLDIKEGGSVLSKICNFHIFLLHMIWIFRQTDSLLYSYEIFLFSCHLLCNEMLCYFVPGAMDRKVAFENCKSFLLFVNF